MMKKKVALIILTTLSAISLASCNNGGKDDPTPTPEPVVSGNRQIVHKITKFERPDRVFTKVNEGKRVTDYRIIFDNSLGYVQTAASYIASNLLNASGAEFPLITEEAFIKSGETISKSSKLFIVGCNSLFKDSGLIYPDEIKNIGGYYIKNVGNTYYLQSLEDHGYQMLALAFLRELVGFEFVAEDAITYLDKNIETLPDLEVIETPDFEQGTPNNNFTGANKYGLGYISTYPFMYTVREDGSTGSNWHNVFDFVDKGYIDTKQEWFSTGNHTQLCYSTRGNKTLYNELVNHVAEAVIRSADKYPTQNVINFTQNDIGTACECDECLKLKNLDGSYAGQVIRLTNDVDNIVQKHYEDIAKTTGKAKRELKIQFFAYLSYQEAPTKSVEQDPTLKCNDNVMVCIAPLHAKFTERLTATVNESYANLFKNWNKYCSNITAWLYETNYHHYMYPYNCYAPMVDNYRFVRQYGATIILNEGQRKSANVTCFGKLKDYLDAKGMFDSNINFNKYADIFFDTYYGDASTKMREYFEQMIAWETALENNSDYGLGGGVYEEIGSKTIYWPKRLLLNWLDMLDEAEATIAKYQATDNSLFTTLKKHIDIERLFPMYALCDLHEDNYSTEEILALRKSFRLLADELGLLETCEHYGEISLKYQAWGLE